MGAADLRAAVSGGRRLHNVAKNRLGDVLRRALPPHAAHRDVHEIGAALRERSYDLIVCATLALVLVLLGAAGLYWVEGSLQPKQFGSIPRALWWAVITLTTVGYGDVYPVTTAGRLIGSIVAIGGVLLVALPTGIVAAAFSDAMQRRREAMARALEDMEGSIPE